MFCFAFYIARKLSVTPESLSLFNINQFYAKECFEQFKLSEDTSCSPSAYPSTLLFAYSNDFSPETVLDSFDDFIHSKKLLKYSWYGSVRFDTPNLDIRFHTNFDDVNATIQNNLPDPNQGFLNSSIGSNVFDFIEKFFSNAEAPVCGSIIYIFLKRYPNEADNSRLVSLIRSHHSIVHVTTSSTPSGGSQPKAMFSVASKTNGMGLVENDDYFGDVIRWSPLWLYPYPVYATTIQLSGSGTKILPDFFPAIEDTYIPAITYQDHFPDDSFQNLTLRWTNPRDTGIDGIEPVEVFNHWGGGNYENMNCNFLNVNYTMTLEYTYSDDTSCLPTDHPKTLLFAYSNDFSSNTILDTWTVFLKYKPNELYSWYGSVRFDIENMDMKFHTKIDDVNSTIANDLPNPNQGFKNSNIGSNVFDVIEKFFSNKQAQVCGSTILILLKRYPDEEDISGLVSIIRYHHAIVHVITSATPSGGSQPKTMYRLTSKTNGIGFFEPDRLFYDVIEYGPFSNPYFRIYATNVQVYGKGEKNVPYFQPSSEGIYVIAITYQDHVPDYSFIDFNLRFTSLYGNDNFQSFRYGESDFWDDGNFMVKSIWFKNVTYGMTLDYNYRGQDVHNLQIRIYDFMPLDNWLPYSY
ncbi:hypothetical protein B9Z55_003373 [Caenorhabditis nigoni]|uniref:DUF7154 domain-containing protein n=1 Tax=Caenorhabditis nigoni TaxID=1611254 RepID=A0A2G5VQM6_9PELO|nr:hypothetical protein B9Z55_003373 [Caenorhabditis nigoni]